VGLLVVATAWGQRVDPGADYQEVVRALLSQASGGSRVGTTLFEEDFEAGTLERWRADASWTVVDDPEAEGKCARVVASEGDHEDLVLKERIPITTGHPIAVCWKTRYEAGGTPLYIRVDYFDAQGLQGEPYARQQHSAEGAAWTQNAVLVSDWFPEYTRAITVHFHHSPGAATTSLLDEVRVVDLAPAARELLAARLWTYMQLATSLGEQAAALEGSPANDPWKAVVSRHIGEVRAELEACSGLDPASAQCTRALVRPAMFVRRFADILPALRQGAVGTKPFVVYVTRPITSVKILPDTAELPGEIAARVELKACRGEYEPASLVLWSPEEVRGLEASVGDLKGPQGVIPAASVDVKYVKCWYQAGTAWHGVSQDVTRKVLVPELLVKDDGLVRVDREEEHNYVKLSFPEGARYVPTDDPTPVKWGNRYSLEEFPVRDSDTLLPMDLPAGENRQLWITVRVPETAASGRYVGDLTFRAGGQDLGKVELAVRVLPFDLAAPLTHYDLARPLTYSLYYWGELDPEGKGSIGYKYKSEEQFRAELRIMYEHGIVAPAMIWSPKWVYGDEAFFRRHLQIAKELGMAGKPLYFADSGMVGNPTEPEALEALKQRVRRTVALAREYDFPEVYFYALDEARGDLLVSQRPAWEAVHEAGGKVFVSGYTGHLEAVGDLLDQLNRAGDPAGERPAEWHKLGHTVWNYAHPQTPPENPELYRRNYGLYLWKLDLDGACTYCFMDSSGTAWNDFDCETYRDHNLAYPTTNGVVGTLALEGFREGGEDVKYATTLRLAIERARAEGSEDAKAKAREAGEWLEGLKPAEADLDEARDRIIGYLEALGRMAK